MHTPRPAEVVGEGVKGEVGRVGGCAVDKVVDVLHKPPDQQQVLFIWNKPILQAER